MRSGEKCQPAQAEPKPPQLLALGPKNPWVSQDVAVQCCLFGHSVAMLYRFSRASKHSISDLPWSNSTEFRKVVLHCTKLWTTTANQLKRGFMWRFFWRRHFFRERLAASAASFDFQIFKGLQHWCYRISWLLHCKARGHRTMRWFHHNGISVNNFDFIWRSWPMHAFINCLQWDKLCEMPDILKFWVIEVWKSERAGNAILHLHIHVYGRIFCNDFNLLRVAHAGIAAVNDRQGHFLGCDASQE